MAYIYDLADTWNAGATVFTAIKMNVTDTASAAGSLLMDLQVGGSSRFSITKSGSMFFGNAATVSFFQDATLFYRTFSIFTATGSNEGVRLRESGAYTWASTNSSDVTADLFIRRDAANTLAQRNGTTAQAFNIYNTFTDINNFERGTIKWSSNVLLIDVEKAGTGVQRHIRIGTANTAVGLAAGNATGVYAVAVGNSTVSNNYTFAAGASGASGAGAIAMGRGASATAGNTIALGYLSNAYQTNQFAFSNRWNTGSGDCQMSMFVLGASTTDTTPTEMSTELAAMTRIVVRASTTWAFEITVVARSAGGTNNAMYMYRGMIKRDASNNTVLVGAVDNIYTNETNAAWDVAVTADDTTESLKVMVTGTAATNINWTGKVILTEVGNI